MKGHVTRQIIFGLLTFMSGEVICIAQGTLMFNNRVSNAVDARVTFLDGTAVGKGFTAQSVCGDTRNTDPKSHSGCANDDLQAFI